jgi:hypothetical protein
VFGTQLVECISSGFGHVWRTLIGDRLHAFATSDGRGEYVDDVLGTLMLIDDDRIE